MKRTNSYIATLDHYNKLHGDIYNELRLIVSLFNRTEKTSFRLMRRGRLGRNSAFASLYKSRHHYHVVNDHAARFDIYLYNRDIDYRDVYYNQNEKLLKLNAMLKRWAVSCLNRNSL